MISKQLDKIFRKRLNQHHILDLAFSCLVGPSLSHSPLAFSQM